jgi:hypothetical protein
MLDCKTGPKFLIGMEPDMLFTRAEKEDILPEDRGKA